MLWGALIASCNKNNDGNGGGNATTIKATNVINSSIRITTVKVHVWDDDIGDYGDVIAQAQYKNNGFTLELPATVPAKYLDFIFDSPPKSITISDRNVKGCALLDGIHGYDKGENEIGYFCLIEENDNSYYETFWMYVDRDVTVKGEYKDTDYYEEVIEKYDLKLKKGWNVVYVSAIESYNNSTGTEVYTASVTSQKPSGVNYQWYYENFYSGRATTKPAFSKLQENRTIK